ncbi:hypothetical protein [Methanomethylophilus alvi]|uniref:hypothetical protein n=1 Tax=Methanomethylophilus alvi TaxID=1291540 RepID=UPI0037DCFB55
MRFCNILLVQTFQELDGEDGFVPLVIAREFGRSVVFAVPSVVEIKTGEYPARDFYLSARFGRFVDECETLHLQGTLFDCFVLGSVLVEIAHEDEIVLTSIEWNPDCDVEPFVFSILGGRVSFEVRVGNTYNRFILREDMGNE